MAQSRHERRVAQRQERDELNRKARAHYANRARNKRYLNIAIGAIAILLILYGLTRLVSPAGPAENDALAQCLSAEGVVMYGTDWCSHCQEQKRLFGESFRYATYVNCDANRAACDAAGVEGYPTWVFPVGEPLSGVQPLATLAARAGCVLAPAA